MPPAQPSLVPQLRLPSVVLFGVAYMAPMVVLTTFGIVAAASAGTTPTAYVLATVAMLFTALSYGKMARVFPVSGSAYTYVRKLIDSRLGFLVGWAILLDYFFLPMVIWLIGASFLQAQFPSVPFWIWVVGHILVTTGINVLGVRLADIATYLLMAFTMVVLVVFVLLSLHHGGGGSATAPLWNSATTIGGIASGAAIAAYSFLGFDAVTTLTEETHHPTRTIPRAIVLTALAGGLIFFVVGYVTQLVHPGGAFADESSAAFDIATLIGGDLFASLLVAGVVIGGIASGLAAQSSVSRLLYAMGRDGVLPRRVFGYLHPRFRTPVVNLALSGAVGLLALEFSLSTSTSFINFGAFTAFTMVNVCVVSHFLRRRRAGESLDPLTFVVLPLLGAVVDVWLLTELDGHALWLGVSWLALGVVWLLVLTRGLRVAPPELRLEETPAPEVLA
ncbi:APC family permease [Geodermatophilus sp. URMC 62]|uniref:APC family permease n=1 Tax=Geodermatophilus sp. URMC 62 TaxID=3423414 RepID=UPI00406C538B